MAVLRQGNAPEGRRMAQVILDRVVKRYGEVLAVNEVSLTVEDGELLYCSHPMLFPVVGYRFDVRNCPGCDCFRERRSRS